MSAVVRRGPSRLRTHLELARASNLPTVWSNGLAASVLTGAAPTPGGLALALVALSCLYVAGMYLNDACDAQADARERPGRPIPSGRIARRAVFAGAAAWAVAGLGAAALAAAASPAPDLGLGWALAFVALAACIAAYDAHHRNNRFSPLLMAGCRALAVLAAALLLAPAPPPAVLALASASAAWTLGLTRLAKDEAAALDPARTVRPARWPLAALGIVPLVGLLAPLGAPVSTAPLGSASATSDALLAAALGLGVGALVLHARARMRTGAGFPTAVGHLVAGIALVDAVLLARLGHAGFAFACLGCFAATVAAQRRVAGS